MTPDTRRKIATATGFLSGVLVFLDALHEAPVFWPPKVVWTALSRPHRLELFGGFATIVVTFILSLRRPAPKR
jgi:hypothetical protein